MVAGITATASRLLFTGDLQGRALGYDAETGKFLLQDAIGRAMGGGIMSPRPEPRVEGRFRPVIGIGPQPVGPEDTFDGAAGFLPERRGARRRSARPQGASDLTEPVRTR